jgi:hypothetical protein
VSSENALPILDTIFGGVGCVTNFSDRSHDVSRKEEAASRETMVAVDHGNGLNRSYGVPTGNFDVLVSLRSREVFAAASNASASV